MTSILFPSLLSSSFAMSDPLQEQRIFPEKSIKTSPAPGASSPNAPPSVGNDGLDGLIYFIRIVAQAVPAYDIA